MPTMLARAALDSIGDAVVVVGSDGGVLHLNPAAEELFARSRERSVGLPARALPGGLQLALLADRTLQSMESQSIDVPGPIDPGIPVRVEASPLLDGPVCAGVVIVLRPRRGNERTLDFEALAAGLAHEIRNPLAGLQGSAELLAREAEGPAAEYAAVIAREAKRVDGLVRELLDLARPAVLKTAPLRIHDIIGDVLVLARGMPAADRIQFVERFDPSLPDLHADDEKLIQVFLNLLRNAIESVADRPAPQITVETGVAGQRLRQASGRTRPLARIAIQDNGPGVSEAMLPRLFTPFATSKSNGTGLGLAISRRIVEAHGGRMEVRNRASGGAEAAVYLPLDA